MRYDDAAAVIPNYTNHQTLTAEGHVTSSTPTPLLPPPQSSWKSVGRAGEQVNDWTAQRSPHKRCHSPDKLPVMSMAAPLRRCTALEAAGWSRVEMRTQQQQQQQQ